MQRDVEFLSQCWIVAGPTAVGKTATAIALAKLLNGEIISLDSMALYRGMDIGTAKPTPEEQAAVRHHLIDVIDPTEEFSVAQYIEHAKSACHEIRATDKTLIFSGGTGLYLRSLLRGVFEGPPADWALRAELEEIGRRLGEGELHRRLSKVDPPTAARLHPNDVRRVVRALEVFQRTGTPLSQWQQQPALPVGDRPPHVYWLSPPRDWLYERINSRVVHMIDQGLVDEVRGLLLTPPGLGKTASQALGYREVIDHLQGRSTLAEAVEMIQTRTRQFAKRQHTWFRNLEECRPVVITGDESPAEVAQRLKGFSP